MGDLGDVVEPLDFRITSQADFRMTSVLEYPRAHNIHLSLSGQSQDSLRSV